MSEGYSVLLPDSRGHGESAGTISYGVREREDVGLWFQWLRANGCTGCVFGMGESMGAAILLQAAKNIPFCALVAESPFASFRQVAYVRVGQFFQTGTWLGKSIFRPAIEFAFLYGCLTRGVRLWDSSPEMRVSATHVPILLIHGLADSNIPYQHSEMILARNPSIIRLWKVPNAGHCGASSVAGHEFGERVADWFAGHRVQQELIVRR